MLAKNKSTGEFFAMKRLKKSDIIKLRQVDHVISENTILADIEHPFLVSYDFIIGEEACTHENNATANTVKAATSLS